jgi:DnaA family protein
LQQIPLAIGPDTPPGFDAYVPGDNAAALAHLRALQPGAAPLTLWGPRGCGKTHLLRALAAQWQAAGRRVAWFDAADATPWPLPPTAALVVIDDAQALDTLAQHAAFALFVQATEAGVPVAAASRLPPVDLPLREDLRTRLGWGHVFALQPLSEEHTRSALRREADRRSFFFADEVMDHLLTRYPRDLATLMALLDRLDRYSLSHQRRITLPLLRQMLAQGEAAPEAHSA